jgi:putative ATP-dependent endonuclease of OLD family
VNGSGIKEALRLILDLEFSEAKIVIGEEPEIHLHYSLEKTIFNYLSQISKEKQVFITTHSTGFIDTCNFSSVMLVKKKENIEV